MTLESNHAKLIIKLFQNLLCNLICVCIYIKAFYSAHVTWFETLLLKKWKSSLDISSKGGEKMDERGYEKFIHGLQILRKIKHIYIYIWEIYDVANTHPLYAVMPPISLFNFFMKLKHRVSKLRRLNLFSKRKKENKKLYLKPTNQEL